MDQSKERAQDSQRCEDEEEAQQVKQDAGSHHLGDRHEPRTIDDRVRGALKPAA